MKMRLQLCLLLLLSVHASAQEKSPLEKSRARYSELLERNVMKVSEDAEALRIKYLKELKGLFAKAQKAGDIDEIDRLQEAQKAVNGMTGLSLPASYPMAKRYTAEVSKLVEQKTEADQKTTAAYVKHLEKNMRDYTKAGKFDLARLFRDEATKYKKRITKPEKGIGIGKPTKDLRLPVESKPTVPMAANLWRAPNGGAFSVSEDTLTLKGKGRGTAHEALAVLKDDLGKSYVVTGEIMVTGSYGGFAFGYDSKTGSHYTLYASSTWTDICYHTADRKREVYLLKQPLSWDRKKWLKFRVERNANVVKVSLDGKKQTVKLPADARVGHWGVMVYRSMVQVRNLKLEEK